MVPPGAPDSNWTGTRHAPDRLTLHAPEFSIAQGGCWRIAQMGDFGIGQLASSCRRVQEGIWEMQSLLWAHAPEHPTCILAPIEVELDRDQEVEMADEITAIYEQGVLRLLTPITLPEHTRVRVQILTKKESRDDLHRAEAALLAAGLVRLPPAAPRNRRDPPGRPRLRLARRKRARRIES